MAVLFMVNLMPDFLYYALLTGLAVAIIAGPLGTFVVWQRLAYFGDTLAHSALLGVALSLWLSIAPLAGVLLCCIGLAILLVLLQRRPYLASDSLLGLLSHGSLALGLVAIALLNDVRMDLNAYLFGDLLAVSRQAMLTVMLTTLVLLVLLWRYWNDLLTITVHEPLALAEGLPVERLRSLLMIMLAILVAIAMQVVGVLLITALLIIPAVSVRPLARSPEHMAVLAAVAAIVCVLGGLALSMVWDTPVGPSIVVVALAMFVLSLVCPRTQH